MKRQRINTGTATYQTQWPPQVFTTWHNVALGSHGQSVASNKITCPHCQNTGIVVLDHTTCDGAACPMCVLGRMQNKSWRIAPRFEQDGKTPIVQAAPPAEWCWRPQDDPSDYSWNHGLGVDHTATCSRCGVLPALPGLECSSCRAGATSGLPSGVPGAYSEIVARGLVGRTLPHVEAETYEADVPDWMEAG